MAQAPTRQPRQDQVAPIVNLLNQGRMAEAAEMTQALLKDFSGVFYLYDLLGTAFNGMGRFDQAVEAYRKAVRLEPNIPDLHFNLAIAQTNAGLIQYAKDSYKRAIDQRPGFFEAYVNLGALLQQQGQLQEAIDMYRKAINIHADAQGYFNLATALRDSGDLEQAIETYHQALQLNPDYADAHNNLGETYRDQGKMDTALKCYKAALALQPDHPGANYNMAEYYNFAGQFAEAIPYFEKSQLDDWQERVLHCLYKTEQYDSFKQKLAELCETDQDHNKPFLATLATHYSHNFDQPNPYRFCGNGLDMVYHNKIEELDPKGELLQQLLNDIENVEIAERKQGRLHKGFQSAGNLFQRPEKSFRTLGELVKREFSRYRENFKDSEWDIIRLFPSDENMSFTSSWYVKMQQGGHLDQHIHEIGWISGAVYLSMPERQPGSNEAAFEYGIDGDDYPRKKEEFPIETVYPNVGEIVLFPSSLFHRTIPFKADHPRICVAFDLKPVGNSTARSSY